MGDLLQQMLNALSLGGTYALLALGLAVVFSILGLINFAHGELMTITGYVLALTVAAGLPFWAAVVLGVVGAALAAIAMERVAFRPMRGAGPATLLLTSLAVAIVLQVAFSNLISARPRAVPVPPLLTDTLVVAGARFGVIQALSILTTAVALGVLSLVLRRTTLGLAMRAAAHDLAATRLMGVRADSVIRSAFAVSGLLAGIAGVLWVAQRGSVDPLMGFLPVLKAFIAAIIGGLGSLTGAVAAGFLLGFIEVSLQAYLPDAALPFRDAFALLLVILVLLYRPDGLFGSRAPALR